MDHTKLGVTVDLLEDRKVLRKVPNGPDQWAVSVGHSRGPVLGSCVCKRPGTTGKNPAEGSKAD